MNVLQMSIAAAILILVIIVVRQLAIHKLPKKTFMILWGVVLLRLLIPFSFNISIPIQSNEEAITGNTMVSVVEMTGALNTDEVYRILPRTDIFEAVNTFNAMLPDIPESIAPVFPVTTIWVLGMLAVALFILVTHFRFSREYKASLPVDNFYINKWLNEQKGVRHIQARQSDKITAPLTYGILKPVILFPKTTDWQDIVRLRYIFIHEMTHIKRFDILRKWLLVIVLCVHWFNPLVWAMYILANRDIELSCDEAVVRAMGESTKSSYAMALIGLEERRSIFAPLCTSFSKNLLEERIISIMKIKKRSIVSIALAAVLVTVLTIGALTVFASNTTDDMATGSYDEYAEAVVPAAIEDTNVTDDEVPIINEPGNWDEWLEWFNSLTPEQQAYVSVRPPQEYVEPVHEYPINENPIEPRNPYRIATSIEEVWAIIALQDGTIPITNVDVAEIRNRQVDGIIILEQCLYEAMDVLLRAYAQSGFTYATRNMATTRVDMSPAFEEMPDYMKVPMIRNEFFRVAIEMGLVYMPPGTGRYGTDEEFYRTRDEALRLLELYDWMFPSDESIRESAQRLYGAQE
ncbi:MAG: M56 family metallopeptidase [Defluviitaleaceae bacterium]|nr:M56 family metallopeptidase [Defluviitaleaceae bacterium]